MIVLAEDAMFDLKFWLPFAVNFLVMVIGAVWFLSRLTIKVSVLQVAFEQQTKQSAESNLRLTTAINGLTVELKESNKHLGEHDVALGKHGVRIKAIEDGENPG